MIGLIRMAPVLAFIIALLGGGGLVGGLSWVWTSVVTIPHEREKVTLELTADFERIAAAAKAAADLKTFQAIERATNHYIAQMQEEAAWSAARDELIRRETKEYERRIAEAGREACVLDDLDLDYLDGLLAQPTGPTSRGRRN